MTTRQNTAGLQERASAGDPIVFTRGVPPPESFPSEEFASCFQEVLGDRAATALQYGKLPGYQGYPPLREELAREYGVAPTQILISNGSLQLFDLVVGHLVTPGATVLTEQPCYDRAINIIRRHGGRAVGVPVKEDGISLARLEAAVEKYDPVLLYLVPDFQNPAGATLSEEKRRAVVALAADRGLWIAEDIPYRQLRYRGEDLPLLRQLDPRRVLTLGSFSKILSPGVRVGFLLADAGLVRQITMRGEDTYLSPVIPTQMAVAEFMRRGLLAPNVERLRKLYRPRWKAMVEGVRRHFGGACLFTPDGGFFLSMELPPQARTEGLVERAKAAGLILTRGTAFIADPDQGEPPDGQRFVRLPFQASRPAEIEAGLERLAALV